MASEPKLFAVFDPDGKPHMPTRGVGWPHKWLAWLMVTANNAEQRRMKRAGYTCREVRIVPVDEVGK